MWILLFIFSLGFLIFFHEFGHFLAAKKAGVFVEEFGFGYPPRIIGVYKENSKLKLVFGPKEKKTKTTIYSFNLFPFGGFVKLYGENKDLGEKSFFSAKLSKRLMITSAGVIFNFFLGMLLLFFGYLIGVPRAGNSSYISNPQIQIIGVSKDSPAKKVGLQVGDIILGVKEKDSFLNFKEIKEFQDYIKHQKGKEVILKIKRKKEEKYFSVLVRKSPPKGEGPIGIVLSKVGKFKPPFYLAGPYAIIDSFKIASTIFIFIYLILKNLIIKKTLIAEVAGPVGIVYFGSKLSQLGLSYLLWFLALLSINLAVINLLPIPAADGGRMLMLLIEKIRKRRVSQKVENLINSLGFVAIIILMIIITFKDIQRFF